MNADFDFLESIPFDHQSSFLYSSQSYISNLKTEVISYCQVNKHSNKVISTLHFQIIDQEAVSLKNAPFGGIDVLEEADKTSMERFLEFVILNLKNKGIKKLTIKVAPSFYTQDSHDSIEKIIYRFKSPEVLIEINHHLEITPNGLTTYMNSMESRKLRKCENSNFTFLQEASSNIEKIYQFITNCRKEKNQSLSMSFNDVNDAIKSSPNSYLLFSAYNSEELIAASICVVVNAKILYNFYPASKAAYNTYSPTVFLMSGIYGYCRQNAFQILDLGTSMLSKEPNHGLIQFKENIGGKRTERKIFTLLT